MKPKDKLIKEKYDSLSALLQGAGLRPTKQRLTMAGLLFDGCDKHVTAEQMHASVLKMRARVSLATVYNTLNTFMSAGLLRQVAIGGGQVYFDTNTGNHYHLFDENTSRLTDMDPSSVHISQLPKLPAGKRLSRVDVVVRMRSAP
jgi:Fur family transcriptional regulator, iron response regulator